MIDLNDRAQLEQFTAHHPPKYIRFEGRRWPYLDVGSGPPTLLSLTGVLGLPVFGWYTLRLYAPHMRVIAPAYNAAPDMDSLTDGIAAILQAEGIDQVAVKGGSYGGFVAQIFTRRHHAARLILSHTAPPQPDRVLSSYVALAALHLMPPALMRAIFRRRFEGTLPAEYTLVRDHYHQLVADEINKRNVIATYQRLIDFDQRRLPAWNGPTLILSSDNDHTVPTAQQQALTGLYPQARVKTFHGTDHSTAILATEAYTQAVIDFVR